jgi:hypothetical protein
MTWPDVPTGAFVLINDAPHLVREDALTRWTTTGYADAQGRPRTGKATVLTPPASVAALRAGYRPQVALL